MPTTERHLYGASAKKLSVARKLSPESLRFWSMAGTHLVEVSAVQPTVGHQRQCQVSGEQFEIL
jgi:hypothetical protein